MPLKLNHIKSRAQFFDVLAEVIQQAEDELEKWPALEAILTQLYAVRRWTANGRKPTFDERKSFTAGRIAARQFEGTNDLYWYDFSDKVGDIWMYFKCWRTDAGLATLDDTDWRSSFPDDYDFSDE